ncbi:3-oxoacyl-[acyl-carrier-protein] synthase III C-terminal domain-containing protein, partial [Bacteroidota bacterium]
VLSFNEVGNTVSASVPISIQKYVESGHIRDGQKMMLIGFGVGYSWGACLVTWG